MEAPLGSWSTCEQRFHCHNLYLPFTIREYYNPPIGWLVAHLVFHHFANFNFALERRMITELPGLEKLPGSQKHRLLDLTLAVAQYQTLVHPRGPHSYQEDLLAIDVIKPQLREHRLSAFYPMHERLPASTTFDIRITHIIGDTVLNSVTWLTGSKLSGMDLYDACIIIFHDGHDTYAVSSVRVLTGKSMFTYSNSETGRGIGQKVPKGAGNLGYGIEWLFWIPCGEAGWIVTQSDQMVCPWYAQGRGDDRCSGNEKTGFQRLPNQPGKC